MDQVEVLCDEVFKKTVGPLRKDASSGQVYLPERLDGREVLVLWGPKGVEENTMTDERVLLRATVTGWEKRRLYKRGVGSGFVTGKDQVGRSLLVVPAPDRFLVA